MQLPTHTDPDRIEAFDVINDELEQVKELISEQLAKGVKTEAVGQLIEHLNTWGGKMIRPGLVLLAGGCCGKITDKHIRVAAIVEIIHNATLLHDDVIDEGQTRRGLPTVNSLWGNESAVLLGDFLLSQVFRMCTDLQPKFQMIIAETTARICQGELNQVSQRQNWQLSEPEYIEIITEKSAVLFSSCCLLGASLAGASETHARLLADFGLNTGIAFQITDDLLDIIGNESKTGKTLGSDADKNKLTLAVIHLLSAADQKERSVIKEKLTTAEVSKELLMELLTCYGSLEYAQGRVQHFVTKAIGLLSGPCITSSDAGQALIETAKFVGQRAVIQ